MTLNSYEGQCHCGNVKLTVDALVETGTCCTCSICSRYASIWGYYTESTVNVTVGEKGLDNYIHGDKCISFNRCAHCGCLTHYTSIEGGPDARLAVNFRMFDKTVQDTIRVRLFDGADTWTYLS